MTTGTASGSVTPGKSSSERRDEPPGRGPSQRRGGGGAPHARTVRLAPGKERSRHTIDLAPPLALSRAGIFPSPSENSTAQGRSIRIIVNMYVCQGSSRDQVLGWGLGSRGETTETAPALVELTFSWGDRPQGSKCLRHRWPLVTDSREEINMIMS